MISPPQRFRRNNDFVPKPLTQASLLGFYEGAGNLHMKEKNKKKQQQNKTKSYHNCKPVGILIISIQA